MTKEYNVYITIILETQEYYIGVHSRMNPDYIGSGGIKFQRAISNAQANNYTITSNNLFTYDNKEDMLIKERELVDYKTLEDPLCLNSVIGGGDFYHAGMTATKDKDGNNHFCSIHDERYLSGELVGVNKSFGIYKDKDNNTIRCEISDVRVSSRELVGHTIGFGIYKDKDDNIIRCKVDDERVIKGELISIMKGKTPVRNSIGEIIFLDKNHPDVVSGKFKHHTKGRKYVRNPETREHKCIVPEDIEQYINNGWEYGRYYNSRTGFIYINNGSINKNINPTELENYISKGWTKGKYNVKNK